MPLWREKTGASAFLLRFGPVGATEVWSCELKKSGTLTKLNKIEKHEALGNLTAPLAKDYSWDGQRLTLKGPSPAVTYQIPMRPTNMPPPALAASFGGQTRVIVLDSAGT